MATKWFTLELLPNRDRYMIRFNPNYELFPNGMSGSFNVIISRVLNLTYAEALRYMRDRVGAILIGKNSLYVVPTFQFNAVTNEFVKLLNNRMTYIMDHINNPYEYKLEDDGSITRTSLNVNVD